MKDEIIRSTKVKVKPGIYEVKIIGGVYNDNDTVELGLDFVDELLPAGYWRESIMFDLKRLDWLFGKLCRACGFNLKKENVLISSKRGRPCLVGQSLWVAIRLYQEVDANGELICEKHEPFDFYPKICQVKPKVFGDPESNGEAYGDFHKVVRHSNGKFEVLQKMPKPVSLDG